MMHLRRAGATRDNEILCCSGVADVQTEGPWSYSMAEPPPPERQPQPMQPNSELEAQPQPEPQPEPELEPEPEPEMLPVISLVELRARGSVLLRPAETGEPGGVVHPMARSNPLGRHSTPPATDAMEQEISHPPSQVLWDGPAVALFALPGGGAAALENACPRALTPSPAGTCQHLLICTAN